MSSAFTLTFAKQTKGANMGFFMVALVLVSLVGLALILGVIVLVAVCLIITGIQDQIAYVKKMKAIKKSRMELE
tara:strand:+ start:644 stop:865 length:222 start_codon:yes stop_codon:yes gene_type:complete